MGAMTVMMAPPSCAGDWWAKARPLLWQYLVVCVKAGHDGGCDVDELAVVLPRAVVEHREGGLLVDGVALHQDSLRAFDHRPAAEGSFEVVVLGEASQHDVD